MRDPVKSALPAILRSVRHPHSGLAALLGLIAADSRSLGVALLALSIDTGKAEVLAVGGPEAAKLGPLGRSEWADGRFANSGALTATHGDPGPWDPGDRVEWSSIQGGSHVLSLVAYGDAPRTEALEHLAGPAFLLAELVLARQIAEKERARLRFERQDRALLAASLQHDLRTPLSGILGFAKILSEQRDLGPEETRELLDLMVAEAEHMTDLVAEGLRREQAGPNAPVKLQPVDPTEIAQNVAEAAKQARGSGEVVVGVEEGRLFSDKTRLTRALLNLVDNAMKYSSDTTPVRLGGEVEGSQYRFVVADSGPGVPEDLVPTLFRPYSTDPTRKDGTGLGLHSVATIARELDGRVAYARRDGWTTFSMWIARNCGEGESVEEQADLVEAGQ